MENIAANNVTCNVADKNILITDIRGQDVILQVLLPFFTYTFSSIMGDKSIEIKEMGKVWDEGR
jgi:hypothetical protein